MTSAQPRREVGSRLVLEVDDPTSFVLAASVAQGIPTSSEALAVTLDGEPIQFREVDDEHGSRLHLFETGPGILSIDYSATVLGRASQPRVDDLDLVTYLRPSRYVQSDSLTDRARDLFGGTKGAERVLAVEQWVHDHLSYTPEMSFPTGGALETLDLGAGVCRDFAHVTAAFLRGLDVPARMVSVYAPQLEPRDFHAVVEAYVDGRWFAVDATRLAPRRSLVRIATGRDATDTAFLTNTLADVRLVRLDVRATSDEDVDDDPGELVELS